MRETVWFLSSIIVLKIENKCFLVRKDRKHVSNGVPIVLPKAPLVS